MHRATRFASAVLTATLSVGITAPAVAGKPEGKGSQAAVAKDQSGKVLRVIDQLDKRLERVLKSSRLRRLPAVHATAVAANAAADRTDLDTLAADVVAGTVTTTDAAAQLKTYRADNYTVIVGHLRFAIRLVKDIDAARADVVAGSAEEATLDEAAALVAAAVTAAHEVTMVSSKAEVHAVKATLEQAQALLETVAGADETTAPA